MGSSFCKTDNSSSINTIEIDAQKSIKPIKINDPPTMKDSQQLISEDSVQTQQSYERKCSKCQKDISNTVVKANCKKNCCFHQLCMEEHIKKLIESGKPIIKCECGTKINTSFLRELPITGKMNLLSRLFERQLDQILQSSQQIRRDNEVQNYVKENRLSKELEDYFFIENKFLIYEETPQ